MLRPEDRTWLGYLRDRYRKEESLSNSDRQRLYRIRDRTTRVLEDLTVLAKILPEDQQTRIFAREDLQPFIHQLLGKDLNDEVRTNRHYDLAELFATYGLNVCQDRIAGRNPDAGRLILRAFSDARELIQLVTAEVVYHKETRKLSLRPRAKTPMR